VLVKTGKHVLYRPSVSHDLSWKERNTGSYIKQSDQCNFFKAYNQRWGGCGIGP